MPDLHNTIANTIGVVPSIRVMKFSYQSIPVDTCSPSTHAELDPADEVWIFLSEK